MIEIYELINIEDLKNTIAYCFNYGPYSDLAIQTLRSIFKNANKIKGHFLKKNTLIKRYYRTWDNPIENKEFASWTLGDYNNLYEISQFDFDIIEYSINTKDEYCLDLNSLCQYLADADFRINIPSENVINELNVIFKFDSKTKNKVIKRKK